VPSFVLAIPAALGQLGIGQGGMKIARSMAQRGWDVRVIATAAGMQPDGVEVSSVPVQLVMRAALLSPARLREDWLLDIGYATFDLMAAGRVAHPDAYYGYSQSCLWSLRRAAKGGARTVVHAANTFVPELRRTLRAEHARVGAGPSPISAAGAKRAQAEYEVADVVRAQSTLVQSSLLRGGVPEDKVSLVAPAVDLDAFPVQEWPADDPFTVGFVGSFSVRKGMHILLDASRRGLPGRLILHGGASNAWSRRLVERACAEPAVTLDEGPPHATYRRSHVCVIPSIEDGYCYVALEAMASGRSVIVTDAVGAKDLVVEGENGFVVPAGDPQALAERIQYVSELPDRGRAMGVRARETASRMTFEREGEALAAVLGGDG
jgi:glycosyltransferase involved in cell wall biosynthesis